MKELGLEEILRELRQEVIEKETNPKKKQGLIVKIENYINQIEGGKFYNPFEITNDLLQAIYTTN